MFSSDSELTTMRVLIFVVAIALIYLILMNHRRYNSQLFWLREILPYPLNYFVPHDQHDRLAEIFVTISCLAIIYDLLSQIWRLIRSIQ